MIKQKEEKNLIVGLDIGTSKWFIECDRIRST